MSEPNGGRLELGSHHDGDGIRLELRGELDVATAPSLETWLAEHRPLDAPLRLEVSGLSFVDSSGLRALMAARRAAVEDAGQPPALVGCSEMLRKLLRMTGLAEAFPGVED